jgi:hypothetical protein
MIPIVRWLDPKAASRRGATGQLRAARTLNRLYTPFHFIVTTSRSRSSSFTIAPYAPNSAQALHSADFIVISRKRSRFRVFLASYQEAYAASVVWSEKIAHRFLKLGVLQHLEFW